MNGHRPQITYGIADTRAWINYSRRHYSLLSPAPMVPKSPGRDQCPLGGPEYPFPSPPHTVGASFKICCALFKNIPLSPDTFYYIKTSIPQGY